MHLVSYEERLSLALDRGVVRAKERLAYLTDKTYQFTVSNLVSMRREMINRLEEKATLLINSHIERSKDRLKASIGKVDALSLSFDLSI